MKRWNDFQDHRKQKERHEWSEEILLNNVQFTDAPMTVTLVAQLIL